MQARTMLKLSNPLQAHEDTHLHFVLQQAEVRKKTLDTLLELSAATKNRTSRVSQDVQVANPSSHSQAHVSEVAILWIIPVVTVVPAVVRGSTPRRLTYITLLALTGHFTL